MSGTTSSRGGLTRRSFLKTAGGGAALSLAGAAALSIGSGLEMASADTPAATAGEECYLSACKGNCGSRCPQQVVVREGKVVRVAAARMEERDDADYRRICVKGYAQPQRLYDPDRVKYPMRRVEGTERGAGQWERVTWDEALDEIAAKMKAAVDEHGWPSVALWNSYASCGVLNGSGAGSVAYGRFLSRTGATILGPGADWAQMFFAYALTLFMGNDIADTPNAKSIFVWGSNPTDAYPADWQFVCRAREKGAKLVTIDPQFTSAAMHSDRYFAIRPGTDGALMLAMANYIIDNGLVNEEFMKARTVSPLLVKGDGTYLRASDLGIAPTEGPVNPLTGQPSVIDPLQVWDVAAGAFADADAAADPALAGDYDAMGQSVQPVFQLVRGKIAEFTVEKAAGICDLSVDDIEWLARTYATEGPVYIHTNQGLGHHANSHHNYKNLMFIAALTGNAGVPGGTPLGHAALGFGSFPTNPLPFVAGTQKSLDICGMYLPDIMETGKWAGKDLPIKVLWFNNGNPLCNESGRLELIEAVKKVDFVVTADITMTDTAMYSDIVLPIPHVFESEDFMTMSFTPYPPFQRKIVDPLYECRTDLEILRDLSRRLGMDDLYPKTDEEYLREIIDTPANLAHDAGYDAFKSNRLVRNYTINDGEVSIDKFALTKTKRLEYYLEQPFVRNNFGQEVAEYERYPYYTRANESYWENPLREKYPLFGLGQHERYHVHSQLATTPVMRELEPEPMLRLNARDAAERGIAQGDYVRAFNDRGSVVLRAKVSEGIKQGVVSIPHGWNASQYVEGHAQDLTNRYMNDFCSNSCFYDFLCEVEKYEGGE